MKKIIGFSIIVLVFTLLYFRAENPRVHFSKYNPSLNKEEITRVPAQTNSEDQKKKSQ